MERAKDILAGDGDDSYQEPSSDGKSDAGHFIQHAIKHPGALHKEMGVPEGEPIPRHRLEAAASKGGELGRRARFAIVLEHLHHGTTPPAQHAREFGG